MALENVSKFEDLLKEGGDIQAKLQELTAAFDGDKSDVKAVFEATVGKLAEELGLPFTFEEGAEAASEGVELSDDELDAVAGGGFCFLIGGSDGPEAECEHGVADCEGHACVWAGVSF